MRIRGGLVPLLLALLGPAQAAAWVQLHGTSGHDGLMMGRAAVLDVYGTELLVPQDELRAGRRIDFDRSPGFVETPHGMIGLAPQEDGACKLWVREAPGLPFEPTRWSACPMPTLVAYDEVRDALILCLRDRENSPILEARSIATGEPLWAIVPSQHLGVLDAAAEYWSCRGGALHEANGVLAIGFTGWTNYPRNEAVMLPRPVAHRLALVDATNGKVIWWRTVPEAYLASSSLMPDPGPLAAATTPTTFSAESAALSGAAVVFTGYQHSEPSSGLADAYSRHPAVVAWTRDGHFLRAITKSNGPLAGTDTVAYGSAWAAVHGERAAYEAAGSLHILDLTNPYKNLAPPILAEDDAIVGPVVPAPIWSSDYLVAPTRRSLQFLEAEPSLVRGSLVLGDENYVEDLARGPDGRLYVLTSRQENANAWTVDLDLLQVDVPTRTIVQRIPLPADKEAGPRDPATHARLIPDVTGGLLVLDSRGAITTLGPGRGASWLLVEPPTEYPAVGEPVRLRAESATGEAPTRYLVHWGEGNVESHPAGGVMEHSYPSPGDKTASVTAVYANGTTATTQVTLHVGAAGPVAETDSLLAILTPNHPAFAFIVVGLAATGTASAMGLRRAHQRRAKLAQLVARVDALPALLPPMPGTLFLGKYEIQRELGRGSFGTAWLAHHRGLDRPVVLKQLHPNLYSDAEARQRFEREARILARIDHPRVVRLFDAERAGNAWCLVMEYVDGGSLEDRLALGPLPASEAGRVGLQVLEGLAHLHAQSVLHRDLKPSNVLLGASGDAKIADFGVATSVDLGATIGATMRPLGTPLYMAPEALRGEPAARQGDLYSVAALVYRSLAGRAYAPPPPRHAAGARDAPSLPVAHLGRAINAWLRRGLAHEPTKRFADAQAMADALRAALQKEPR